MGTKNKVTIRGNLGQDPEIKSLQDGTKLANLSLATSESWTDKNTGEKREKTQWHRVVVWGNREGGGLVKPIEKFLAKGDQIEVEGQLEHRSWEKPDGSKGYATEVVLKGPRATLDIIRCKSWENNRDGVPRDSGGSRPQSSDKSRQDDMGGDDIPF